MNLFPISAKRLRTLLSLLFIVPVGFYSKFYKGPSYHWVNNSLGGTFYEIFWCLFFFLIFQTASPRTIAALVLLLTCLLEFLQLWHPLFLEFLRSHFIGQTVLGTTFSWSDFPYYLLGCGVGWLWMTGLQKAD